MPLNCRVAEDLESPLDCKEVQPVHPKGNQWWLFLGRTVAEAETPVLWSHDAKFWLIWKDPDVGNDWRQEEWGWQKMRWLDGITDSVDMSLSKPRSWWWTGRPGILQSMGSQRVGHDWVIELKLNILWHFLSLGLEWKLTISSPVATAEFFWFADIECSTFTASAFSISHRSTGIPSPALGLFIVMLLKAHLTWHFRMSGSRWVITPLWLSGLLRQPRFLLCILATSS